MKGDSRLFAQATCLKVCSRPQLYADFLVCQPGCAPNASLILTHHKQQPRVEIRWRIEHVLGHRRVVGQCRDDHIALASQQRVVESVKAASDCYLPVAGEIAEINEELEENPDLVNSDPYGDGWFVQIVVEDTDELAKLMTPEAYQVYVERLEEEGEE